MNEVVVNHIDGYTGLTNKIKSVLENIRSEFIYIGFLLDEADRFEYYLEAGFDNIYDYCELNFGFKKSSTNNFIRVYRCFGDGMFLKDNYKDYSYSQLTEMCSMTPHQLSLCSSDKTVLELRQIKRLDKSDFFQTSGKSADFYTVSVIVNNHHCYMPCDLFNHFLSCCKISSNHFDLLESDCYDITIKPRSNVYLIEKESENENN